MGFLPALFTLMCLHEEFYSRQVMSTFMSTVDLTSQAATNKHQSVPGVAIIIEHQNIMLSQSTALKDSGGFDAVCCGDCMILIML